MRQVLIGDRAHRDAREVHLLGAAEVEQEVEGTLERLDADGDAARLGDDGHRSGAILAALTPSG